MKRRDILLVIGGGVAGGAASGVFNDDSGGAVGGTIPPENETDGGTGNETDDEPTETGGSINPSITTTNSPVDAGSQLTVDYMLINTAESSSTTDVWLETGGGEQNRDTDVTVPGGGTQTGQLSYTPTSVGSPSISVSTTDSSVSQTVTVETAIPDTVIYNFESGDMSKWDDAPHMQAQSSKFKNGTHAGFTNNSNDSYSAKAVVYPAEQQITEYSHDQAESSNGNGMAVVYYDGSGNEVFRTGSSNRDIQVAGAGGGQTLQGTGNTAWYNITVTFDWDAGTFTAISGGNSATLDLKSTSGIKSFEIWPVGNVTDSLGGGDTIYGWYDNIKFTT